MPRLHRLIQFGWLACAAVVAAVEPPETADPLEQLTPREAAIELLFSERGEAADFDKAVANARDQKIGRQVILEARFLYQVDRRDDAALAAMAPEFLERRDRFQTTDSEIFALREDWLAVVEYVQAIAALQQGDRDKFKSHITEAFWLSPRQGAAFASHIERLRTAEEMSKVRVDFTTSLMQLAGDKPTELAGLIRKRKALALHFWSPWSRECEAYADDFAATVRTLDKHGITVASLLAESDPRVVEDARAFAKPYQDLPCHWLRDNDKSPLHTLLRVQSVPVLVLVAPDGRVLFNGHPADQECWKALKQVAPELARPPLASPADNP